MRRAVILVIVLAVFAAAPALAEQVIHFTNGNTMPIRSHTVQGDMIHVDLGGDAFMAFPMDMVEKVVQAGKNVILERSVANPKGVMVDTRPDGTQSRGRAPRKPGSRRQEMQDAIAERDAGKSKVEVTEEGQAVYRPHANHAASNRRQLAQTGNRAVMGEQGAGQHREGAGYQGTSRLGNRHVIGSTAPPGTSAGRQPISMQRNGSPAPPPAPADKGDASQGSKSDE